MVWTGTTVPFVDLKEYGLRLNSYSLMFVHPVFLCCWIHFFLCFHSLPLFLFILCYSFCSFLCCVLQLRAPR